MRVLLVEDDRASRMILAVWLTRGKHQVTEAASGSAAAEALRAGSFDVIIMDIGLPEGTRAGFELVRSMRADGLKTPVVFLSARSEREDRISGLDLGGDAYLVKPCHLAEVEARMRAVVRRAKPVPVPVWHHGSLEADWAAGWVKRDGTPIILTAKEWALFKLLATRPKRLFSRSELFSLLWDDPTVDDQIVVSYVKLLRKKLGPDLIETVRNVGYRLRA